ncbi:phospho-sugar mutase [Companilactobacillus zhachilii]|uniref:phospho-sugar mutase n=1 Tax=Companilactobacillus zhachilii TaxID=2304606 RepID=UPI004033EACC
MDWQNNVQLWQNDEQLSPVLRKELQAIKDDNELKERFSEFPTFGTGGIRAKLGVGTSRLNYYTVARVTFGLANYILKKNDGDRGVVISYDTRHFSKTFAVIAANILIKNNIKVYICDHVTPTPELSFLVRNYKAAQGIMITASHNPAIYNGYKVYDDDGGQITLEAANEISSEIEKCLDYLKLPINTELKNSKLITVLDGDVENLYLKQLKGVTRNSQMIKKHGEELKIVYTPLHGTGLKLVTKGLAAAGFSDVNVVKEQAIPDPDFPTVEYPNPEYASAFKMAIKTGNNMNADILIATDPDADRLGVAVRDDKGQYNLLSGNQLGALMIDYLGCHLKSEDDNKYQVVKTIVTSDFGATIADYYHCRVRETLTGFKFIGEQIEKIENAHDATKYLFGYEESYGYLISPYVRDKDSIQAAVLTAEIALSLKLDNKNLLSKLDELYHKFGYYQDKLITKTFKSKVESQELIGEISVLRENYPKTIGSLRVKKVQDFEKSEQIDFSNGEKRKLNLPKSNVIKIILEDGSWMAIRPSGTEPKIKIYLSSKGKTKEESSKTMMKLNEYADDILKANLN